MSEKFKAAIAAILDPMIERERKRRDEAADAWDALRGASYVDAYQVARARLVGDLLEGPPAPRRIFRVEAPGLAAVEIELGWKPGEAPLAIEEEPGE